MCCGTDIDGQYFYTLVHLVPHEGHTIRQSSEFFLQYCHYLLEMLRLLHVGANVLRIVVPDYVNISGRSNNCKDTLGQQIEEMISYLGRLFTMSNHGEPNSQDHRSWGQDLKELSI